MQVSPNIQITTKDDLKTDKPKTSVIKKIEQKVKNPAEKTILKPINDVATISLGVANALQAPEQISFFPNDLKNASNSIRNVPIVYRAAPTLVKTSKYIEGTKVFTVATNLSRHTAVNKASFAFGKAVPYLNAVACGYTITKGIYTLKNEKETNAHKEKAVVQIALNTASAIGAFKPGVGTTISAVSGITSVGLDLLWK